MRNPACTATEADRRAAEWLEQLLRGGARAASDKPTAAGKKPRRKKRV